MDERPAINASPLIYLARADLLPLLQVVSSEHVIPSSVWQELRASRSDTATIERVQAVSWLCVLETPTIPSIIHAWDLGAGESAVLSWGHANPNAFCILDDRAARRCAASLRIRCVGTVGVVLRAKQDGVISLARPVLEVLRNHGMYLSDRVLNQALSLVNE